MAHHGAEPHATLPLQPHSYHLVNPSPWPLLGSIACLGLTLGGAMTMHNTSGGPAILMLGFALLFYTMFVWWRDVVKEAVVDHAHSAPVTLGLRLGMGLFIISEVMFFAAFFWAFFNASTMPVKPLEDVWAVARGVWPPEGIKPFDPWHLPLLNTLILLLSGTTVTWAHYSVISNNRRDLVRSLALTVMLGVIFTICQAWEYSHAAFGFKDGVYASTFYMATGFHGLHVIVGTVFLAVCLGRAMKGHFTPEKHLGLEFAAWYWHFVDVVWLFLYVFVYLQFANRVLSVIG